LSRITLWRINNGYDHNQATELQQYLANNLQKQRTSFYSEEEEEHDLFFMDR
jgi:hypothetical protein